MTLDEAKRTIAKYLVGEHVLPERLEEARCLVVERDPEYVQYLRGEYGLDGPGETGCDLFMDHVAEFSELSEEARRREMPELLLHLEDCLTCRKAYWEVRCCWVGTTIGQRLAEGIRLLIDRAGSLIQRGLGPPATEVKFVAATANAPLDAVLLGQSSAPGAPPALPGRREWELGDEEHDCSIRLVVMGMSGGQADVACSFEGAAVENGVLRPDRLEVRMSPSGALCHAAPFSGSSTTSFSLEPGAWTVRLKAKSPRGVASWDIPLEIEAATAGENS